MRNDNEIIVKSDYSNLGAIITVMKIVTSLLNRY